MRLVASLLLLACATACAVETTERPPVEVDGAVMSMPDAHPVTTLDAGHPDVLGTHVEASTDGGLPSTVDGAAASQDGARADAGAAGDGAVLPADAHPADGGLAADASARERAIAQIEGTYAGQPCGMFDGPYCGAVIDNGIVFEYPLACVGASSRTAMDGSWTLAQNTTCTRPCQTPGALCPR